jgi:hypothetical protein
MNKKTNWDDIPLSVWNIIYYKEDDNGNTKFYDFVGDASQFCDGIHKDELEEMSEEKVKQLNLEY